MIKLRELIEEAVVYSKFKGIKKGMEKRHGSKMVGGTFGVEFEFKPEDEAVTSNVDEDGNLIMTDDTLRLIRHYLMDSNRRFNEYFNDYIEERKKYYNVNYIRWYLKKKKGDTNLGDPPAWDDTYGPISLEIWQELNGYSDNIDDNIQVEDNLWRNSETAKEEYFNLIEHVIEQDLWRNFVTDEAEAEIVGAVSGEDSPETNSIKKAINYIGSLKERVIGGETGTEDTWAVGRDGDNVEIRSKHMTIRDIPILKKVLGWLKGEETNDNTSAHVHIGLPEGFNAFNLICLWDLVDEKQVKLDIGAGRNLNWAKLQDDLRGRLYDNINKGKKEGQDVYSMDEIGDMIRMTDRYFGTNLQSYFRHRTVEFRYFSSQIKNNINKFIRWILYFLMLPKIAMHRKQVTIEGNGDKIVMSKFGSGFVKINVIKTDKKGV